MIELVQLEKAHEEFAKRNTRVIVVSVEGQELSKKTQAERPLLIVLSDEKHGLTDVAQLLHKGAAPDGSDVDMPTTFLIDGKGTVRWLFRSDGVFRRLTIPETLEQIEKVKG